MAMDNIKRFGLGDMSVPEMVCKSSPARRRMKTRILLVWLIAVTGWTAHCQNPVLEVYINKGIASNHALKQRQLDYNQSLVALKEARGLFFPDVSLSARYTVADGGRVITFPVGDLLNPVYTTLNFPMEVENQEFRFYRPKEQETKLTLVQPIYNSDLIHNARIREEYSKLARVDMEQYKRNLIREIKTAYYNYQKAWYLAALVDSTLLLVMENHRVSKTLYENDLVTVDAVYRSEAEVSSVRVQQARARGQVQSARSYFNFLINRPLDSDIERYAEEPADLLISLEAAQEEAVNHREEMTSVKRYQALNAHKRRMQQGNATPDLFGMVDYGFQGEEYSFTGSDDFVLASVVLRWQLFQGMSNRNKIRQTRIEGEKLVQVMGETEQKIRMQVIDQYYKVLAAYQAIEAAEKQVSAAEKAFSYIDRKYRENQATLLAFIDARTSYTSAKSNLIITVNDYFIQQAGLEFAMAGINLENY